MRATFPSRGLTRLIVVAGGAASVVTVAVFALAFPNEPAAFMFAVPWVVGYVGGLVAFRTRPELVAARRLVVFGAMSTLWIGAAVALITAFEEVGARWWLAPGNVGVQVLGLGMWAAMIGLLAVYPDGAYRRRRLRLITRTASVWAVALPVALLVTRPNVHPAWMFFWGDGSSPPPAFPNIASPLHLPFLAPLGAPLRGLIDVSLALSPVAAAIIGWLRYRCLRPTERLAMRWPMYGLVTVLVAPLAAVLQHVGALSGSIAQLLQVTAVSALPASLAVGIVRPDLFDIDRAMRRSVVYAVLWTAIALAYVGGAAALGLAALGEGGQLAIAATIGATLLFEPGRRALARRATQWAYGETVTGEALVQRLGTALEHTHDLQGLLATVASVAREGLGVRWARVRVDGLPPAADGDTIAGEWPVASAPLVHGGRTFGEVHCGPSMRTRRRAGHGIDEALLANFARQAALAVQNARLASELRFRFEEIREKTSELEASRSRIVAAHESARRQIERDIHDGAQQELVALIAGIGLARRQSTNDPGGLDEALAALQVEAGQALDNLRRLAAGIHPSVLSDHGLVEAIEIRSSRMPLPITVDCDRALRRERFGDAVEGAAYFFVSEALANVLKHAKASKACVRVRHSDGDLVVAVEDDGIGFEPTGASGTGLRGLTDRVEAIGGSVELSSSIGTGTRLTMKLPL